MGGHIMDQPLPAVGVDNIDPFLLIHHWDEPVAGGMRQQEVGVGPHPHRGFSPVTFVYKGDLEHRDSLGNRATVGPGGTQWMHAGKGITHSERPSADLAVSGGDNEFIQFWVNTPAKHKMEAPYYLPLTAEETPTLNQGNAIIQVVAGSHGGVQGPARTYSEQILLRVSTSGPEQVTCQIPASYNTIVYVLNGNITIGNQALRSKQMAWMDNEGDQLMITAEGACRYIILAGQPIGEKISSYGPFVMNTQTEILQALKDAQMGKMGVLIEEFD